MLDLKLIKNSLSDVAKQYCDFMVKHFRHWPVWAEASQRVADGQDVGESEVPDSYRLELKMMKLILEMESKGVFDWRNPELVSIFQEITRGPFYKLWGETIVKTAIEISAQAGVNTLVEIGAGRGNLTEIMLKHLSGSGIISAKVIATDTDPSVLEHLEILRNQYPDEEFETMQWDIRQEIPGTIASKIVHPCLVYERSSIVYADSKAFENLGSVADFLVLGDWFNNTGRLYAFDEVFKRIGAKPLFYSDIEPLIDKNFKERFFLDARAQQEIDLPNATLMVACKSGV